MRTPWLICLALLTGACSKDGSVLTTKPNLSDNPGDEGLDVGGTGVVTDPCLNSDGPPLPNLWTIVDGPASCTATNPARPEGDDTILQFTGSAWSEESALCRAQDAFWGATVIQNEPTLEQGFVVPEDAIGYCIINEQTEAEVVMYSTCGIQSAAQAACEQTLPSMVPELTARWEDCPKGARCAPLSPDVCFDTVGDGKAYSMYVDNPDLSCPAESDLDDTQDTLLFTLGAGYKQSIAICVGTSAYDQTGGLSFGVSAALRRTQGGSDGTLPDLREGDYSPAGAKGYCLFYEGTPKAFVLFSMCDELTPTDQGLKDALTPQQACEMAPSITMPKPRPGVWYDCPGSTLCVD